MFVFISLRILTLLQLQRHPDPFQGKLPHITFNHVQTLGAGGWLNDEIINYFVTKWCSQSQNTLGLNTFFACKNLFQDNLCTKAKCTLTMDDEIRAKKWCRAAEVYLLFQLKDQGTKLIAEEVKYATLGFGIHSN
jgi:hypothetical protein